MVTEGEPDYGTDGANARVVAGRYRLEELLGRGGMGVVWRATDQLLGRGVAVKELPFDDTLTAADARRQRERTLREARALAQLSHPNIIVVHDVVEDDERPYIVLELIDGPSLAERMATDGPVDAAEAARIGVDLLGALRAAHAAGVLHRDIKPANVLLEATGRGRPKLRLSDFGIAMRLGEPRLTETDLVVGTPGYLAPEQMMGAEPDFPADLFAVGLVALYLLEGAKPDAKALIRYFADHGTPGAPQGIPEPLWQVVATLLQPDPEARFRTATGARKALAAAAELLPEPGPDDELIEIFDQLGPLPPGFAEDGPEKRASGLPAGLGGPVGAGASEGGTAGQSVVGGSGEPGPHLVRSTPPPDPRHGTATGSPATPPDATPQPAPLSDTGRCPQPPPRPAAMPTPRSPA
ncbi:protein kinase, partial [Streptomyces eurythermus]|uniref:serine/threonine-protein kinase n=1 Tax=Streptomyces eurythermus TaxID=42237 RepID=UPI0036F7D720